MATKKFETINTGRLNAAIAAATDEEANTAATREKKFTPPEQAAERLNSLQTRGAKGCKAVRINMAFTPDNHEFIAVMAKITGHTMTEFTNIIIKQYREEHPELFQQAKAIRDVVLQKTTEEGGVI